MYICDRCHYACTRNDLMRKHLSRKRPCPTTYANVPIFLLLQDIQKLKTLSVDPFVCEDCKSVFSHRSSLSRHRKICKDRVTKANLLKIIEKLQDNPSTVVNNVIQLSYKVNQTILIRSINRDILYVGNNGNNYSDFALSCIMGKSHGFIDVIKKVYFNEDYPENCVMAITDPQQEDHIKIFDGDKWLTQLWPDLSSFLIEEWWRFFDFGYQRNEDAIRQRLVDEGKGPFEYLNVDGFIFGLKDNEHFKEELKRVIIDQLPTVKKIHGYIP